MLRTTTTTTSSHTHPRRRLTVAAGESDQASFVHDGPHGRQPLRKRPLGSQLRQALAWLTYLRGAGSPPENPPALSLTGAEGRCLWAAGWRRDGWLGGARSVLLFV